VGEIPDCLVRPNRINGFLGKWKQGLNPFGKSSYDKALQADIAFTQTVARLKLPPHDVFFGYSYMSLEMLEAEQGKNVLTILDQIDPGPVEFRLVADEMSAHPELAGTPQPFPTKYYDRLRREWDLADVIVVNSEWSREALISEGVDPTKIEILPLAYEAEGEKDVVGCQLSVVEGHGQLGRGLHEEEETTGGPPVPLLLQSHGAQAPQTTDNPPGRRPLRAGGGQRTTLPLPLRVLWLGQVNVRKGIHYLIDAARLLERENVQFEIVGPVGILPGAVAAAPKNMTFHGPVSRDRAAEWYRQSDVFVLPTLSDGFALTQLEALAHGVPVIATPNCGRVVTEGETGFIVPARDACALADAILRFVHAPGLAAEMGAHCREVVKAYSVDAYGQRLVEIIEKWQAKRL
jgi:glycosyltransferase involved in cell wall biosynthesis